MKIILDVSPLEAVLLVSILELGIAVSDLGGVDREPVKVLKAQIEEQITQEQLLQQLKIDAYNAIYPPGARGVRE